jgi:hypothetical protein
VGTSGKQASMSSLIRIAAAASLILAGISSAPAVIIKGGDGTGNTTAPTDDPGWANVGAMSGASCVYLGGGWVISASHVTLSSVTFGNSSYAPISSSYTRLYEPNTPSQAVDLAMFRLQTVPTGLSALTVSSTEPSAGAQIDAIGYGLNRAPNETFWDADWNVVSGSVLGGNAGYYWGNGATKRWGTNNLIGQASVDDQHGITDTWETVFNSSGSDNEMQAAVGDSGGGVFYKRGNSWELAGIMLAVDSYYGQPGSTAVFGNPTYFADLSVYSGEIAQVMTVPEPSMLALILTGSVAGWFFWRRRGAAR